mgnify:CR=1 FL=1
MNVWRAGIAKVRIEVLEAPAPLDRGGRWCVQIGALDQENAGKLKLVKVDDKGDGKCVEPTVKTVNDGTYQPLSRPLFIYVKKQHVGQIPGIAEFIAECVSDKAIGQDGYLADKGLVTLPGEEADKTRAVAKDMTVLTAEDVK